MLEVTRRSFVAGAATCVGGLCAASFLSSCSGAGQQSDSASSGSGQPQNAEQVIVAMPSSSEPAAGFNPLVAWGCGEHVHEPLIQSTLITTNDDMTFNNDLATEYSCSDDGLTWTFTIREDVKFTNGEPLTANDVAFTLNGIRTSPSSECDLSYVSSVEAPNDTTVTITLEKPNNTILYMLAVIGIVPAAAYTDDYGSNPIGSGRYMLEQWDKGQQVILVANPDYYGEAPKMKRVVIVFMGEDASLAAAQSGQVDLAYTSATFADSAVPGYDQLVCASVDSRGVSLPCVASGDPISEGEKTYEVGNPVTSDKAVRQAINYGIDRKAIADQVLSGYGTEAFSVSDGMPWASTDMRCETDVARAEKILEDAGWKKADDGIRVKDNQRCTFDLYYSASDTVRQALSANVADQLKPLGIEVVVKGGSWDDIREFQYTSPIMWGWGSNSPSEIYSLMYSTSDSNFASYKSSTTDAYIDQAIGTKTVEESYDFWKKAQWDGTQGFAPQGEAPWVWLVNVDHLYFVRSELKVAKQKPHPHGHGWSVVNNVDQWEWM